MTTTPAPTTTPSTSTTPAPTTPEPTTTPPATTPEPTPPPLPCADASLWPASYAPVELNISGGEACVAANRSDPAGNASNASSSAYRWCELARPLSRPGLECCVCAEVEDAALDRHVVYVKFRIVFPYNLTANSTQALMDSLSLRLRDLLVAARNQGAQRRLLSNSTAPSELFSIVLIKTRNTTVFEVTAYATSSAQARAIKRAVAPDKLQPVLDAAAANLAADLNQPQDAVRGEVLLPPTIFVEKPQLGLAPQRSASELRWVAWAGLLLHLQSQAVGWVTSS